MNQGEPWNLQLEQDRHPRHMPENLKALGLVMLPCELHARAAHHLQKY